MQRIKVWYKPSSPTVVTGINKDYGEEDELSYECESDLLYDMDTDKYVADGVMKRLLPKDRSEIDRIDIERLQEGEKKHDRSIKVQKMIKDMKAKYEKLIRKGQDIRNVKTYIDAEFPTLNDSERAEFAKIVHMLLISVSVFHTEDD